MKIASKLNDAIRAVCPIQGVSIGNKDDKQTWRIDFKDEATTEQRAAAADVVDAFTIDPVKDAALAAIAALETGSPMTHRGHGREFPLFIETVMRQLHAKINALDAEIAVLANRTPAPLPYIPVTHMIAVIKTVDDLIKVERAKL